MALMFMLLIPIAAAATIWEVQDATGGHLLLAVLADTALAMTGLMAVLFRVGSTPEGFVRVDRLLRRLGSAHHDPSSTRRCPRCGLPMDVISPDFYTGPRSPKELCHRCTYADEIA
jgi:hypothetical protein